jgi:hypothetical protein
MREMVPTAPKNVKTCTHAGMLAKALCMCVRQTEYTLTLHARARARTHTHTQSYTTTVCTRTRTRMHTHLHKAPHAMRFVYLCILYMYVHKHTVASARHLYTQPPGLLALKHHAVMHHEAGLAIGHGVLSRLAARVHAL